VEITIAAATLAPIAQTVSKKWTVIDARPDIKRFAPQAWDFEFLDFVFMIAPFSCCSPQRKTVRRAIRTSVAVGFEPTPTSEDEFVHDT
jgi:hypothetical protein